MLAKPQPGTVDATVTPFFPLHRSSPSEQLSRDDYRRGRIRLLPSTREDRLSRRRGGNVICGHACRARDAIFLVRALQASRASKLCADRRLLRWWVCRGLILGVIPTDCPLKPAGVLPCARENRAVAMGRYACPSLRVASLGPGKAGLCSLSQRTQ